MLLVTTMLLLAAADPNAATGAQPEPKEKLICRREVPIGSLIASRKICLTKSQWDKRATDGNEAARKMVYENMGTCLNPAGCNGPGQ
ncbi:hypothetical protein SCH01S_10_00600 [Sphingomonas changbaiensis NBRC 104936]|uniref:Nuclease n=1 Tax=Sphingomonas changbaiensis NBRC 104936 TaxID=1219043 RepID=A0A0E9MM82_9SPHN|nr:hypothetical protein [Sphingomonas changbaiensis]GAO38250.1 hypothetical protein SCH01S_10_00600 [Sphingomonas changbaiensis NBRC 104936]